MKTMSVRSLERLDPGLALRAGTFDAQAVLALWCARKSFFPVTWLGLTVAIIAFGDLEALETELSGFDDPGAMVSSLLSPLGVLVAAVAIRVGSNLLALVAAFPLTLHTNASDHMAGWKYTLALWVWWDRLYMASAYRALRWTWAVRNLARDKLGASGRILTVCEIVIRWAAVVFFITFLVAGSLFTG